MEGFERVFYLEPEELGTPFDYFDYRRVKGYVGSSFSVIQVPDIVHIPNVQLCAILTLTKRDTGVEVTQFMDGQRCLVVTNAFTHHPYWMFEYLEKLSYYFMRFDGKVNCPPVRWKEE